MKQRLFQGVLIFMSVLLTLSAKLTAQQQVEIVPWGELSQGKMIKKILLEKDNFTLRIVGKPAQPKIRIFFKEDFSNKIPGKESNNNTDFNLDDFLSDITDKGGEFFISDAKTNKNLDSFFLVRGSKNVPGKPGNEKADEVPIAFYDAQDIYNRVIRDEPFLDVFAKYNFPFNSTDSMNVIRANPFIKTFLDLYFKTKKVQGTDKDVANANSGLGSILASLSGIDVTKYVQASADFLRDRVKQELAIAFIEKFKNVIDNTPELRALLPKTYNVFSTSDPFKVPSMGQTYKTAFQEDLEGFIENFEIFVDTTSLARFAALKTSEVFTAFRLAYHTIDMSANDFHPIDIFEFLNTKFGVDISVSRNKEINKYISLLNLISQHLRKRHGTLEERAAWVSVEDLKKFNPNAVLIFWGLVYEQNPEVFDGLTINTATFKDLLLTGSNTVQVYLKQFVVLANNIDKRIKEFNTIVKEIKESAEVVKGMALKDFVANADKLVDITDFIFSLPYFKDHLNAAYYLSAYYTQWRPIILDVIETTKGIYVKDYGKIAVNATSLFNDISRIYRDKIFSEKFLKNFTFYSNFLVDAINADSANDVKAVLNRYAQPVGSYRVKRKSPFTVSLNAYPGLYFGWETYKNKSNSTFGVTAPLGLAFNLGNAPSQDWSTSLFLSAVDIGAALSFRWSNDTLDLPQKITLGQIFSPGAFIVVGFPKVPIAARFGAQYAPQLRSITKDGNTVEDISTWRFGVSVVVDIPIFNF